MFVNRPLFVYILWENTYSGMPMVIQKREIQNPIFKMWYRTFSSHVRDCMITWLTWIFLVKISLQSVTQIDNCSDIEWTFFQSLLSNSQWHCHLLLKPFHSQDLICNSPCYLLHKFLLACKFGEFDMGSIDNPLIDNFLSPL